MQVTVPPETIGPFAAILPRSNRGFDLRQNLTSAKPRLTTIKTTVSPRFFRLT